MLAIAASLLGAAPVVAIDDDPDAIQAAWENLPLNPWRDVTLSAADLRSADLPAFDIVLANLTGGLLIQAAARLRDLTSADGRLILSGFMAHEEADVLAAFAAFAVAQRARKRNGYRHPANDADCRARPRGRVPRRRAGRRAHGLRAEEFAARRQRLAKALERGTLVMFGATDATPGVRFRQDNDFFYLTGNEGAQRRRSSWTRPAASRISSCRS